MKKTLVIPSLLLGIGTMHGEIVPHGQSGSLPGKITGRGTEFRIEESLGTRRGSNLFHSFQTFNLGNRQTARFKGSAGINNVISRVTGGTPSNIRGTIQSDIQGANLFLINPAGIVFGKGAAIDVSGSFTATTANYVELGDGTGRFSANPDDGTTLLTSAPPSAFGFLSNSPKPIALDGAQIQAFDPDSETGGTLALIGGDIHISGGPFAISGDSALVSVGSRGRVVHDLSSGSSPPIAKGFSRMGTITLKDTEIGAGEESGRIRRVFMRGGDLLMENGRITSLNGDIIDAPPIQIHMDGDIQMRSESRISTSTFFGGSRAAANINLRAHNLILDNSNGDTNTNGGTLWSTSSGTSKSGNINIAASGRVSILDSANIFSTTNSDSPSSGGNITIQSSNLSINGNGGTRLTGIRTETNSSNLDGSGGMINLEIRDSLEIFDHGSIDAFTNGSANAGSIRITTQSLTLGNQSKGVGGTLFTGISSRAGESNVLSIGTGGDIKINANSVTITNGARIDASTYGKGEGGTIILRSHDLEINGTGHTGRTGIVNFTNEGLTGASGHAGSIKILASGAITLHSGGLIDSSTFGTGEAGNVEVSADSIKIDRGGKGRFTGIGSDTSLSMGGGNAGDVTISVKNKLTLLGGGLISAATFGSGNAGNVTINSGDILISGQGAADPSVVTTRSGIVASTGKNSSGRGGNVRILAEGSSLTIRQGGQIGTQSIGSGDGGLVTVSANTTRLLSDGRIISNTTGTGTAGSIKLSTHDLLVKKSEIGVRTKQARAGKLSIHANGKIRISEALITATAEGDMSGGDIRITSNGDLNISHGSRIEAASTGSGNAGSVIIDVASTRLTGDSLISSNANGTGKAGGIKITTGDLLVNGSEIGVQAASGDAGNIDITSNGKFLATRGLITASAGGSGGNITIHSQDSMRFNQSILEAEARKDGGEISISGAPHLILDQSSISANAIDGNGGAILLKTGTYFSNESEVTASSEFGTQGIIRIDPVVSFTGGESTNAENLLNPNDILQPNCIERDPDTGSSFTKTGRGGTRRFPGGYLPSFRIIE